MKSANAMTSRSEYNFPQNQDNSWLRWVFLVGLILAILAVCSLISSCSAGKHLPTDQTHTKDSTVIHVRDSVNVRDSLVLVPVPVESSQNVLPEFVPSHLETSLAVSDAWVDTLGLHHTLKNIDKPIPVHVPVIEHVTETETTNSSETATIHTEYVEVEKPLSWWQSFKIGAFWWLCGALALALLWIFRKPIAKLLKIVL